MAYAGNPGSSYGRQSCSLERKKGSGGGGGREGLTSVEAVRKFDTPLTLDSQLAS